MCSARASIGPASTAIPSLLSAHFHCAFLTMSLKVLANKIASMVRSTSPADERHANREAIVTLVMNHAISA